jgi:hypothetical protein
MNKAIIFLDIDGVLNSSRYFIQRNASQQEIREHSDADEFDPEAIKLINNLCVDINAYVVISSTWRIGRTIEELQNLFTCAGATFKIVGVTPIINYSMCRGLEVQEWLSKNREYGFEDYVIIDDDSDFFIHQIPHFFHVDNYHGITPNTCYKIRRFFKVSD